MRRPARPDTCIADAHGPRGAALARQDICPTPIPPKITTIDIFPMPLTINTDSKVNPI